MLQTALYQLKSTLEESGEGIRLKKKKALQDGETLLPFALTDAQKRVLAEIEQDMTSGKIMNRLVQGMSAAAKRRWQCLRRIGQYRMAIRRQ